MAIKPHPSKEKTWIIDFAQLEGGRKKYHLVEFAGSLKEAFEHQIFLRKSLKKHEK
jgi:hypothetical protein